MFNVKPLRFVLAVLVWFEGQKYYGLFNTITKGEFTVPAEAWKEITSDPAAYDNTDIMDQLIENKIFVENFFNDEKLIQKYLIDRTWKIKTLRFVILPNRTCNLRCKYCFERTKIGIMNRKTAIDTINFIKQRILEEKPPKVIYVMAFAGFIHCRKLATLTASTARSLSFAHSSKII